MSATALFHSGLWHRAAFLAVRDSTQYLLTETLPYLQPLCVTSFYFLSFGTHFTV